MNIIFGREYAATMSEKYTVLELDTIRIGHDGPEVTAFCVIENVSITDMPKVESMKILHENLILEYKKRNWAFCNNALEHLVGFWNQEVDTFYDHLKKRVDEYEVNPPADDWTGTIERSAMADS